MDPEETAAFDDFMRLFAVGKTKAEQVDALEDLAAELQERAETLRAELRNADAAPASAEAEE